MVRKLFLMLMIASCTTPAISEVLPPIFTMSKTVDLPISVGESSFESTPVTSKKVQLGDVSENSQYFNEMEILQKMLANDSRKWIFSLRNRQWSHDYRDSLQGVKWWEISKLPCVDGVKCYLLFSSVGDMWLITTDRGRIIDFQLVMANQYEPKSDGGYGGSGVSMDTLFGDNYMLPPLPMTYFRKTGIFCTSIAIGQTGGMIYKRRITPQGKIENKRVDSDKECKAPW